VPMYIQKLNREPILRGHAFSTLEVRRPPAPAQGPGQAPAPLPRFLEFALISNPAPQAPGDRK